MPAQAHIKLARLALAELVHGPCEPLGDLPGAVEIQRAGGEDQPSGYQAARQDLDQGAAHIVAGLV